MKTPYVVITAAVLTLRISGSATAFMPRASEAMRALLDRAQNLGIPAQSVALQDDATAKIIPVHVTVGQSNNQSVSQSVDVNQSVNVPPGEAGAQTVEGSLDSQGAPFATADAAKAEADIVVKNIEKAGYRILRDPVISRYRFRDEFTIEACQEAFRHDKDIPCYIEGFMFTIEFIRPLP